jgi:hypothetical protein
VSAPKGPLVSLFSNFGTEFISIFSMPLAIMIVGQSRPWSDRDIFSVFNASQRLSTLFNTLQRDSTLEELAVLKRVEQLAAVTFRTSLEGRSTRSVGRELLDLKRSVRVHPLTCPHWCDELVC